MDIAEAAALQKKGDWQSAHRIVQDEESALAGLMVSIARMS